jgi:hypothetical protein
MKIVDAMIIRHTDVENLNEQIAKLILKGWQPQGGVSVSQLEYVVMMVVYGGLEE